MTAVTAYLKEQPAVLLFLILGLGYLIGRVRIAGVELGSILATLVVAIVLGHYGVRMSAGAQAVGFALFMFSVGYQAGPRFREVIRAQGVRYFVLAVFVVAVGLITTWCAARLLRLPYGAGAGLIAGAMTSAPALAAAQETVRVGIAVIPPGATPASVVATIGSSYAITFLVGMFGTLMALAAIPKLLGLDLAAAARALETDAPAQPEPLQARAYRIENPEFCVPTLGELAARLWQGRAVVQLQRGTQWLPTEPLQHLRVGDELHVYGRAAFFLGGIAQAGPEIRLSADADVVPTEARVVVAAQAAVGSSLGALGLEGRGLVVLSALRDGLELPVSGHLTLHSGDLLTVIGPAASIRALPQLLGPVEHGSIETDMTMFVFGIAIGGALGLLSITVRGIPLTLGAAGGLLLSGIAVGWFNSVRPTAARFPAAARWILMEFGMAVFVAGAGLSAGGSILEALRSNGLTLLAGAAAVVLLPLTLGYLFGHRFLKLEPVVLLGALTGAMTCTPALRLVTRAARSPLPALGYTGTYPFACVLMALVTTLLMVL